MCLTAYKQQTDALHAKIVASGGSIICWKELVRVGRSLKSLYYKHCWRPGWNDSGRKTNRRSVRWDVAGWDIAKVSRGIHVWTSPGFGGRVPVRCHAADLVGVSGGSGFAVFRKVWLAKADRDAAMKGTG